jgi:hypothetical protein
MLRRLFEQANPRHLFRCHCGRNASISTGAKSVNIAGADKNLANHADTFDPPIYNGWKQQEKTPETGLAIMYPEPEERGRGKKSDKIADFSAVLGDQP